MSKPEGAPGALACDALRGRPQAALNLIHRNNCSKPASMRVAGRFDGPESRWQTVGNHPFGALRWLMSGRADGTT